MTGTNLAVVVPRLFSALVTESLVLEEILPASSAYIRHPWTWLADWEREGLIRREGEDGDFRFTEKGRNFLRQYKELIKFELPDSDPKTLQAAQKALASL